MTTNANLCSRCGKQRIVVSTTEEIVNNSVVTRTESVCPDPDCQKRLEMQNQRDSDKRRQLLLNKTSFSNRGNRRNKHED